MTRWRMLAAGAALLTGALVWAAFGIGQTPGQLAADAKPPHPSVVTARVEERQLGESVALSGTFVANQSTASSIDASLDQPVVTALRTTVGAAVNEGDVVAEVSGRPVIVLRGDVPVYRTLASGSTGRDVSMFQASLGRILGREIPGTGTFDAATRRALHDLYQLRGYDDPAINGDDTELGSATNQRDTEAAAELRLAEAVRAQAAARTEQANALADLEDARAAAAEEVARVKRDTAAEESAARDDVTTAESSLEAAASEDRATAEADLRQKRATFAAVESDGDAKRSAAARDEAAAARRLRSFSLDTSVEDLAVSTARAEVEEARSSASGGAAIVPRSEFIVVAQTPALVSSLLTPVGATASGATPAVLLSAGAVSYEAVVDRSQATVIRPGMSASISLPTGDAAAGTISSIEDAAGRGGEVVPGAQLVVVSFPASAPLPSGLVGQDSLAAVEVTTSEGAVPSLPVAALRDGPKGTLFVRLVPSGREVTVTVGLVASGYAAVDGIDVGTTVALG